MIIYISGPNSLITFHFNRNPCKNNNLPHKNNGHSMDLDKIFHSGPHAVMAELPCV